MCTLTRSSSKQTTSMFILNKQASKHKVSLFRETSKQANKKKSTQKQTESKQESKLANKETNKIQNN